MQEPFLIACKMHFKATASDSRPEDGKGCLMWYVNSWAMAWSLDMYWSLATRSSCPLATQCLACFYYFWLLYYYFTIILLLFYYYFNSNYYFTIIFLLFSIIFPPFFARVRIPAIPMWSWLWGQRKPPPPPLPQPSSPPPWQFHSPTPDGALGVWTGTLSA